MKLVFRALSSFFYRLHAFIERRFLRAQDTPAPYQLNYAPDRSRKKIIHINANFLVGGTTQLIVDIIERTSDDYYHQVVVPEHPERLPYQPVDIRRYSIGNITGLHEWLRAEKPALVHIHYWARYADRHREYSYWYQAVYKVCEELGLKVIQNVNVPTKPWLSAAVIHNVYVSEYVRREFGLGNPVASSVIHPGSNFKHFHNPNPQLPQYSVGMVYRLDTDKLNKEAIEVFIEAVKFNRRITCYIVGDGQLKLYFIQRTKEAGVANNFVFTGMVSFADLPSYYKRMSLFVAPVHDESFGQVTPFAMSMGLAVAGYDTGALSEILGDKTCLVPYGDIKGLARMMVKLVEDKALLEAIGRDNQRRTSEMFSVDAMVKAYRELYNQYTEN